MSATLEERVAKLEKLVAEIHRQSALKGRKEWLESISGKFANDPIFDQAMALGRKYREAQRPKPSKSKSKK